MRRGEIERVMSGKELQQPGSAWLVAGVDVVPSRVEIKKRRQRWVNDNANATLYKVFSWPHPALSLQLGGPASPRGCT